MSRTRIFTTAFAAMFIAAPLMAQDGSQNTPAAPVGALAVPVAVPVASPTIVFTPAPSSGPTIQTAAVGVRANASAAPVAPRAPEQVGHNPAMMIVGGAALIVGAVVGGQAGTIVMIVGGVIGLVGLWNYLQ